MVRNIFCCLFFALAITLQAKDFVVVIDAGHGGHDPGAIGSFAKEKNINLNIALKLGDLISNNLKGVKVLYTRNSDVFIPLKQRAQFANKKNADLFISIHTNAVENKSNSPQGVETYSLGLARSEANLAVAKRENAVILMEDDYKTRYAGFNPNSAESYIIFEFMQDKHMEQSVHYAKLVQKQMSSYCGRANKGVKQAGFLVLREVSMPSVLIEVGFISHPEEERYLSSELGCQTIAEGIFRAFKQYKLENDARITKSTSTTSLKEDSTKLKEDSTKTKQNYIKTEQTIPSRTENLLSKKNKLVFKIQIIASKTEIPKGSSHFKGLSPIDYYHEGNYYKYTYSSSTDYNIILRTRKEISAKFSSAFIVAFRDGEKVNINEAIREFKQKKK
ncbi:MAG: N-acetylmuramoyl-L-alanine amidase [Bacteroidaceae bacterium]